MTSFRLSAVSVATRASIVIAGLMIGNSVASAQVDAADYVVWRKNYGADCNADRKVDAADYAIWRSRFNTAVRLNPTNTASLQWRGTDLNCNGTVDAADYVIWRKTSGL